jgi:hypothetical protein
VSATFGTSLSFEELVGELRLDDRTVSLRTLLAVFQEAERRGLAWAEDFGDESVEVSPDLFDVVTAFRCYAAASRS